MKIKLFLFFVLALTNLRAQSFIDVMNNKDPKTKERNFFLNLNKSSLKFNSLIRYNDHIKLDSYLLYRVVDENDLVGEYKLTFDYEEKNNTSIKSYEYNSMTFEQDGLIEKSFNEIGLLNEVIEYQVNSDGDLEMDEKYNFSYYSNGQIQNIDHYYYTNGEWDFDERAVHLYDGQNRIEYINYYYELNTSIISRKEEYTYSDTLDTFLELGLDDNINEFIPYSKSETIKSENKTSTYEFNYDEDDGWINYIIIDTIYNNIDKTISIIVYDNDAGGNWFQRVIYKTRFNEDGKNISYLRTLYDIDGNITTRVLDTIIYNTSNQTKEKIRSDFDTNTKTWFLFSKEVLSFDGSTPSEKVVYPFDYFNFDLEEIGFYFQEKLDTIHYYDYNFGKWELVDLLIVHYSPLATSLAPDKEIKEITIFPNPVSDFLYFNPEDREIKSVNLYNSNGILIKDISGNINKVDVSALNSGIYFYTLQSKTNEVKSGKVIVSR